MCIHASSCDTYQVQLLVVFILVVVLVLDTWYVIVDVNVL